MAHEIKIGTIDNKPLYITKHKWDCNWYFSFGYIGNRHLHTHFDSTFIENGIGRPDDCKFGESEWYVICDYFKTAYALKAAYEVYYRGNSHITSGTVSIKDVDMANRLKNDLERVLDLVWDYMTVNQIKDA
jgi:hypothetical protein